MSSSRSIQMMLIMEEDSEAKIGGSRRTVPGELLLQGGALVGQGTKGVVSVASEMEAAARGEEVIDEATVLTGGPLNDVPLIKADAMVDLRRGATTSRGTIRGRLHAGSAHSSGPHWPQEEMESTEARGLLPRRGR